MSIVTTCSHCRTRVRTREDAEGKRAKCPRCGQVFIVEVPSVEAAADDVPERIATNIRCGFVPRTDRRDPGLEPPDGSGDSIETPVTFKVVINRDSDCELKGAYQAALNSEGLRLSKAKANPYLIPVGTQAEYLGGNTLAVMVNSRRIEAKITKWAAYQ